MTMPQLDQIFACPGCGEPLEDGDRYCGVCGVARLAATDQPPGQAPTEPDFTLPPPLLALDPRSAMAATHPGTGPPLAPAPPTTAADTRPDRGHGAPGTPCRPAGPPAGDSAHRAHREEDPPAANPAVDDNGPEDGAAPVDPRAMDVLPAAPNPLRCTTCGSGQTDTDGYCGECGRAQPGERDHVERALGGVAAVSDLGLRHHRNEDAFTVSATALADGSPAVIAVVCDGVSSASRPDAASATAAEAAVESLLTALPRGVSGQQATHDALLTAARAVVRLADDEPPAPGRNSPACTIVSAVTAGGVLTVGWIGDSRAYWVPEEGAAARLTEDDSWAAQMVAAGLLSEEEAMADHRAHAITAWLGADAQEVEPHTASFKPDRPGVVIVCTDGLWNYAESAEQMAQVVPHDARGAPLPCARRLVQYALASGGHDNVTVAVIPFPVAEDRADQG